MGTYAFTSDLRFLGGGGEMGEFIRTHDWSRTLLGPPETWPQALRTSVRLMLNCAHPMYIFWGAEGICLYNDAYRQSIGPERHPRSLGKPAREVWAEIWDIIGPQIEQVMGGGAPTWHQNALVPITRNGMREDVYWTYTYSPIDDETAPNFVGGVLVVCSETTDTVLAERRAKLEGERFLQLFQQAPTFMTVLRGPEHRFEYANPRYYELIGNREVVGKTVAEALPDAAAQGYVELLDRVYSTGEAYVGQASRYLVERGPGVDPDERFVDFVYQPIRTARGDVDGIFVEGLDATQREQAVVRSRALAELGDYLRDINDPDDIAYAAAEMLGRTLQVSRAGYGTIHVADETIHIERDWNMPGVESLAGVLHFRDYGSYIDDLKRGITVVVHDAEQDSRTASTASALKAISACSFVNMPVTEDGGFVALLYLNHALPRKWTNDELDFVRDVAQRTRTAVERRRAEMALSKSEQQLRFLDALAKETLALADADIVLATTTRMLGEHMGVASCAYADMDMDQDGFAILGDWGAPGTTSIVGHYRLRNFGQLAVDRLSAGLPLIIQDCVRELPPDDAAAFGRLGIAATICMPLVKQGRLVALLAVHDKAARAWTKDDVSLVLEVTERSWTHVQRVGVESELRASVEQFRTLARTMPNQAWMARPDGGLDWFNEQVYDYSGAQPGSLDGTGWTSMVHPDDLPQSAERWSHSLISGETYEKEFRLRRADGVYRWHIARAVPIKNSSGLVVRWIGTNTDIDDQKAIAETLEHRVEERTSQLRAAEDRLRQSQKMEAIGQLTGGIAHDFNNMLTGVIAAVNILKRRLASGSREDLEPLMEAATSSAMRAASLTQRLLAFSRRQSLDPKPVDINGLIGGLDELITRSARENIAIELKLGKDLPSGIADANQLENAILNLVINARDAMPDGGTLTITTGKIDLSATADAAKIGLDPGGFLTIEIADTGVGMSREVLEKIFEPFFTTKPVGQGTGLGLSMVYGFAQQSNGQVRVESRPNEGTRVILYLPAGDAEGEAEPAATERVNIAGDGRTVLIVEDDDSVRLMVRETISELGFKVVETSEPQAAIRVLHSDQPIDLMMTDVGLPGMNGRQLAEIARQHRPDLPILFVTGYAENAAIRSQFIGTNMSMVMKPFTFDELAAKSCGDGVVAAVA